MRDTSDSRPKIREPRSQSVVSRASAAANRKLRKTRPSPVAQRAEIYVLQRMYRGQKDPVASGFKPLLQAHVIPRPIASEPLGKGGLPVKQTGTCGFEAVEYSRYLSLLTNFPRIDRDGPQPAAEGKTLGGRADWPGDEVCGSG